jgi:hypothetical protein
VTDEDEAERETNRQRKPSGCRRNQILKHRKSPFRFRSAHCYNNDGGGIIPFSPEQMRRRRTRANEVAHFIVSARRACGLRRPENRSGVSPHTFF